MAGFAYILSNSTIKQSLSIAKIHYRKRGYGFCILAYNSFINECFASSKIYHKKWRYGSGYYGTWRITDKSLTDLDSVCYCSHLRDEHIDPYCFSEFNLHSSQKDSIYRFATFNLDTSRYEFDSNYEKPQNTQK